MSGKPGGGERSQRFTLTLTVCPYRSLCGKLECSIKQFLSFLSSEIYVGQESQEPGQRTDVLPTAYKQDTDPEPVGSCLSGSTGSGLLLFPKKSL